jgi:hypothetical protein
VPARVLRGRRYYRPAGLRAKRRALQRLEAILKRRQAKWAKEQVAVEEARKERKRKRDESAADQPRETDS